MKIKLIQDIIDFLRGKPIHKQIDWHNEKKYKENICQAYSNCFHKKLDLKNPKTLSEKIQWLRVYDNTPLKTQLADKYLVREWVKEKIGEEYLIPLLGVYDNFDEIDFSKLPDSFVIQCNHGSGYNIIVKDKAQFNINGAREKINEWMKENYAYFHGEFHYKDIKRKIIVSKYLEELSGSITDYKYYCFNGKPYYIQYIAERENHDELLKSSFFDLSWNDMYFYNSAHSCHIGKIIAQPQNLNLMNTLAEKLCHEFKYVRVDFYNINGKIYFGEMTFTPFGGYFKLTPSNWDKKLGDILNLGN